VELADQIIEDKSTNYPGAKVDSWKLKHVIKSGKAGWDIDISPDPQREAMGQKVEWYGCKQTNGKEPKKGRISARTSKLMKVRLVELVTYRAPGLKRR